MSQLPTTEEVTNLYLYGREIAPLDMTAKTLIRASIVISARVTILDSDGQGSLLYDGVTLAGGAQYGDARVHRDASGHLYVDVGSSRLVIDGNIVIEGQQAGTDTITSGGGNDVIATKAIAVCAQPIRARGLFSVELRAMNNSSWRVAA